jgi:Tfp pilus assembly protein PilF
MRHGLTRLLLLSMAFAAPGQANTPNEASAALSAGARRFFEGNPRAARIELLNAIKADPENALPHALQGRIYLALGDGAAAEAEIQS